MFSCSDNNVAERIKKKISRERCLVTDVDKQAHWKHNGCCTGGYLCAFGKLPCVHFAPKPAMMLHFYNEAIFKIAKGSRERKDMKSQWKYSVIQTA